MGDDPDTSRFTFDQGSSPALPPSTSPAPPSTPCSSRKQKTPAAEVRENITVEKILHLADGDVTSPPAQTLHARYLIDASGQSTFVARHLGTRQKIADPDLQKVAYFGHFENVEASPPPKTVTPASSCPTRAGSGSSPSTSAGPAIGLVTDPGLAKHVGVPADRMLAWAVARCPVVRDRMKARRRPGDQRGPRRLQLHLPALRRPGLLPRRRRRGVPRPDLLHRRHASP